VPNMPFVHQDPPNAKWLVLHRSRILFIRQQTAVNECNPAHLAVGSLRVAPSGRHGVEGGCSISVADPQRQAISGDRSCLSVGFGSIAHDQGADLSSTADQGMSPIQRISMRLDESRRRSGAATALVAAVLIQSPSVRRNFSGLDRYCAEPTRAEARTARQYQQARCTAICRPIRCSALSCHPYPRPCNQTIGLAPRPCWRGGRRVAALSLSPTKRRMVWARCQGRAIEEPVALAAVNESRRTTRVCEGWEGAQHVCSGHPAIRQPLVP